MLAYYLGFGAFAVCLWSYFRALRRSREPWPDFGGRAVSIDDIDEWTRLLDDAKGRDACVLVDAYALWCPPCKIAAPVFARMSEEYASNVTFAKVNVDTAPDVARHLQISAMPTFKLLRPSEGELVGTVRGWDEDSVRRLLARAGVRREFEASGASSESAAGEHGELLPKPAKPPRLPPGCLRVV